eukprot:scaffold28470_cov133-Amphora_coffeaeformis.AAC.2
MTFHDAFRSELEPGERVEADDGYRGDFPQYVKCLQSMESKPLTEFMSAIVRRRHKTINKRFKQWSILLHKMVSIKRL